MLYEVVKDEVVRIPQAMNLRRSLPFIKYFAHMLPLFSLLRTETKKQEVCFAREPQIKLFV